MTTKKDTGMDKRGSRRISFLVPDIHSPVLGPVTVLARTLERHYPVEIVGPDFGHGVCPMYRDAYPYTVVPTPRLYRYPDYFRESRKLEQALSGSLIIAVKAYADTIPVALRAKRRRGAKVMAYLDEWDGALVRMLPLRARWARRIRNAHHPLDDVYYPLVERMIPRVDKVISTSTFLQHRFGGEIVHMGVDTEFFRPVSDARIAELKSRHNLTGLSCIVFGGVVRPHKGIELLLDAMVHVNNPDLRFVIAGPINDHVKALQSKEAYRRIILPLGAQSREHMPGYLTLADMIVLPLNDTLLAQSQTPCKIFEAMSMARPIIASDVADLPRILDGCGHIVPPGDVSALAGAIRQVLRDPASARAMGRAAREKCIREYSREVTERKLVEIIEKVLYAGRSVGQGT